MNNKYNKYKIMEDNSNALYYKILNSVKDKDILYEEIEVDGQRGVRCRKYINIFKIINDTIEKVCGKNLKEKYYHYIQIKCKLKFNRLHKVDSIVLCWPTDEYNFNIGKKLSLKRVDNKIKNIKKNVHNFVSHIKHHNFPKDKERYEL